MQAEEHLSITLPAEIARIIRDKVATGQYASASEVVGDSLLTLAERDEAVDAWLTAEVVPAYDRLRDDPGSAITIEKIRKSVFAK